MILSFLLGIIVGVAAGVIVMALVAMAKDREVCKNEQITNRNPG